MSSDFSPLTRKVLAIGLLILALLLVWTVILSPLFSALGSSLTELDNARFQRLRLEQIETRPTPEKAATLAPDIVINAQSKTEASDQFTVHFSSLANGNGLQTVSVVQTNNDQTGKLVGVEFALSGPEENIVKFINIAEKSAPNIRFRNWQITAIDANDPNLQFSGQALAGWTKP